MLLKITNTCQMRCSHCLENSLPDTGQHMTRTTFLEALACTRRVEDLARVHTGYNLLLFSGGECTEHPEVLDFIDIALAADFAPVLITNGLWLDTPLAVEILARPVFVQVTHDPRFYPRKPPVVEHPAVVYVDALSAYIRLGRGVRLNPTTAGGLPARRYPGSFNLRSFVRACGDIRLALVEHRRRALTAGGNGHCTPSISQDGTFIVGESRFCAPVGTVRSSPEELTAGILRMGSCNTCGLEDNLDVRQRAAIGV